SSCFLFTPPEEVEEEEEEEDSFGTVLTSFEAFGGDFFGEVDEAFVGDFVVDEDSLDDAGFFLNAQYVRKYRSKRKAEKLGQEILYQTTTTSDEDEVEFRTEVDEEDLMVDDDLIESEIGSDNTSESDDEDEFIMDQLEEEEEANLNRSASIGERNDTDNIMDVFDGSVIKDKIQLHGNSNQIFLQVNWDGASPFSSSKWSMWPIYVVVQNLPPEVRYNPENLFMVGLWYGKTKPGNVFLDYFVQDVKSMENNEVIINNGSWFVNFCSIVCDLPAKAIAYCMSAFNGLFGCGFCLNSGHSIQRRWHDNDESLNKTVHYKKEMDQSAGPNQQACTYIFNVSFNCISVYTQRVRSFTPCWMALVMEKTLHPNNIVQLANNSFAVIVKFLEMQDKFYIHVRPIRNGVLANDSHSISPSEVLGPAVLVKDINEKLIVRPLLKCHAMLLR
ncbi:predicted protein, partial [Naegleria gruberi]